MAALLLHVLRPDRPVALLALGAIAAGLIALDLVRLRAPAVNAVFFRAFRLIASPREEGKPASSTWFVLGLLLAVLLFPLDAVIPGILVLALADPAASVAGRLKGRRPLGKGTVEGTLVFLAVALAVLLPILPLRAALAGALAGAAAEIFLTRLDDNLSIPLAVAAAVTLAGV
jgi:dolichol kinase